MNANGLAFAAKFECVFKSLALLGHFGDVGAGNAFERSFRAQVSSA